MTSHDIEQTTDAASPPSLAGDDTGITIRPLDVSDADAYRRVWMKGVVESPQYFRIAAEDIGVESLPTRHVADDFTLGAFAHDRLIGVVSLRREPQIKLRHKALVFRMFVDPDHAGAGIGRALMSRLIDDVHKRTDIRQIHLTVLATNERAMRLYQSLDFVAFARETDAVKIGDRFVDELQMARRLR
jgi:RimJ/RimL family protein N-acetyltransferase